MMDLKEISDVLKAISDAFGRPRDIARRATYAVLALGLVNVWTYLDEANRLEKLGEESSYRAVVEARSIIMQPWVYSFGERFAAQELLRTTTYDPKTNPNPFCRF